MPTKEELVRYFKVYTDEMARCQSAGCYWAMLHLVLSLPDICSALKTRSASGDEYENWCNTYLAGKASGLTGKDWWVLRNMILHRGMTIAGSRQYAFGQPSPSDVYRHGDRTAEGYVYLDVAQLAHEMMDAMDAWLSALVTDQKFASYVQDALRSIVWDGPPPLGARSNPGSTVIGSVTQFNISYSPPPLTKI